MSSKYIIPICLIVKVYKGVEVICNVILDLGPRLEWG
jgi:hypothetical protein